MSELQPRRLAGLALLLILLAAAGARFVGLNWDQGQHLHPDERFLTMVTAAVRWPSGLKQYLNESQSPLNPRNAGFAFFAYGTLPVTLVKAFALVTGLDNYDSITLAGRAASAAADLTTVLLLYWLGLTLYRSRRIALLAAFFYGLSAAAIQQAHFFVVDPFANCALTAALLLLARYQLRGRIVELAAAGVLFGLALASKLSVASFALTALLVCLLRGRIRRDAARLTVVESELFRAMVFAGLAIVTFRFASPDAFSGAAPWSFLPASRWLSNLSELLRLVSGEIDTPPGHQWVGRTPLLFPWINMVVWGMGIPLGLAAWTGFGIAASRLRRPSSARHLIPLSWAAIVFLQQGTQWAMTLRYFLPAYGSLCLLAAWLLIRWRPLARRRWVAWTAAAGTALWALAFIQIYTKPHNRVSASVWIYDHVPKGSALGNEHWDDALPLRMRGLDPFGGIYTGIDLKWYDEDSPEKLAAALDWLDRADYLILSSNRLSDSIPRLPARYPMTSRYYQALFDGSLGFHLAAVFDHAPGLFGMNLPTHLAEEAFSVYDHPRVHIFRKTQQYSRENSRRLLDIRRWDEVVRQSAREASKSPAAFMLTETQWRRVRLAPDRRKGVLDNSIVKRAPWLPWLAAMLFLGVVSWPVLFVFCPGLPDRGYALSKFFGLLVVSWLSWAASGWGLIRFGRTSILLALLLVALFSAVSLKLRLEVFRAWITGNWRTLLGIEVVFFVAFVLMAMVRLSNPDLWHPYFGGEKPMDVAYLTAVAHSGWFPPQNPWFAGGFINYYYFGFVPPAALLHLTSLTPEVAYNLAVPSWYALACVSVFGVALALVPASRRRGLFAVLSLVTVMLAGNLKQVQIIVSRLVAMADSGQVSGGTAWAAAAVKGAILWLSGHDLGLSPADWYFRASRAIPHSPGEVAPITEFPYFTFLYGDLHAHLLTLPASLLCLGLIISLARQRLDKCHLWAQLALVALALGGVWAGNTWELPALAVILLAALLTSGFWNGRQVTALTLAVGTLAAAWLAFLPYHQFRSAGYGDFSLWTGSRTPPVDFFIVYGVPLLPVVAACVVLLWRRCKAFLADSCGRLAGILALTGFGLTLVVEVIVLQGDIGRSNTVFKLGFQAWILLGLAAGPAAHWMLSQLQLRTARIVAVLWAIMLALALVYPVTATPQRARDRFDLKAPRSWDGLSFLSTAEWRVQDKIIPLAGDRKLILWLRNNARGNPVIAEWNTFPILYGWGNRISNYTGFPSIVGWDWHLRQQMPGAASERVARRIAALQEIYVTPAAARAAGLLESYEVDYIVVGALERSLVAPEGLAKFQAGEGMYWDRVFYEGADAIYRVRPVK